MNGETVTVTFSREEWETLALAAAAGAMSQQREAATVARLYGLSPEVAKRSLAAGKSWTMVAALRLALAGVTA